MITINETEKMIGFTAAQPYPASFESVEVGTLYKCAEVLYRRLEMVEDDLILHTMFQDDENQKQFKSSFNLDEFHQEQGNINSVLDDLIIKYMREYRKNFAISLIFEARYSTRVYGATDSKIYYNPNNVKGFDFAYLVFDHGSGIDAVSQWKLFLSASPTPCLSANWNDKNGILSLIKNLSEPLENLKIRFALQNPTEASTRTELLSFFCPVEKQMFSKEESTILDCFMEELKADKTSLNEGASLTACHIFRSVRLPQTLNLDTQTLAFDCSFFVKSGEPGDQYIKEIKEKIQARGGIFIAISRTPRAVRTKKFPFPLDRVLGIIVKDEKFFEKNSKVFFDSALGEKRLCTNNV